MASIGHYGSGSYRVTVRNTFADSIQHNRFPTEAEAEEYIRALKANPHTDWSVTRISTNYQRSAAEV